MGYRGEVGVLERKKKIFRWINKDAEPEKYDFQSEEARYEYEI